MKITISGPPGSGTTTVAKIVAEKLGLKLISAGDVFRQLAAKKGMTVEEFSQYAEENPEIDRLIDQTQKEMAEKEKNVVVEGRLSGWFVKNADLKVWIFADPEVRYSRIAKREGKDLTVVRQETRLREEFEKRRYWKFYSIDIDNWTIYDLIINSGSFDAEGVVEIILKAVEVKKIKVDQK
ncbi:(d)CMP kinase [Archaeoglobus fulgidus]|jgi:cytidylate kinase|uniref:Cytidylate kinase n=2 Tax=Archaeoglobus fulgidus TaxID=2234 RepID=KCY_ARCFU|nr:AAA family ATPase [Archaeoglobus fulgidus]O28379.1 RecName: Full=Cytidylate kinase; Short=CK; AltName: Full=Cytidine monophosphate kinase; Short=CMP kinase [Archaeoglobus fulgidus DSM 4304]AAB89349.1 cytidylate kinase (cmk) [Archaeoglobus fulgidus DSM 4304]AIG98895.1 cytidylate kinase, putative [Archaeoglobus fulgidus DSM 8774]